MVIRIALALAVLAGCRASGAAPADAAAEKAGRPVAAEKAGRPVAAEKAGQDAAADKAGRLVCVRVGTRSEGWAWPDGRFIHWAKCKGVVPKCQSASKGEGWYARGDLIVAAPCKATRGK